jgi:Domain of unknown function (DUF4062)
METIYIASTYEDLKDYREAVYHALRKLQHNVIAMEDYVATDQRPLNKCLDDIARCNIYIGIFAWRYGYIPEKDNPERKSITELEYDKATELNKQRLIFLLHQNAPWSPSFMDAITSCGNGQRIQQLRDKLRNDFLVGFFKTPDDLALAVSIALNVALAIEQPRKWNLADNLAELEQPLPVGGSEISLIELKIQNAVQDAESRQVFEINLGDGKYWWSTRLYLLAALAVDFTKIRQFVFVDADGVFIGMASPWVICHALLAVNQGLSMRYKADEDSVLSPEEGIILTARGFLESFKPGEETTLKEWVTKERLKTWLGDNLSDSRVSVQSTGYRKTSLFLHQIIDCPAEFVAVVTTNRKLVGVVNRTKLAVSIAETELRRRLEQED